MLNSSRLFATALFSILYICGCATKIEHTADSEELRQTSDEISAALTLSGGTRSAAIFHPSSLKSSSGPRLHSVRAPLMYLSGKEFTLTLHCDPDDVPRVATVNWQLDYGSELYEIPANFSADTGIMTIDAELASTKPINFQSVAYIWLTDDEGAHGTAISVSFQFPRMAASTRNKDGAASSPQTDKVIYTRTLAAHGENVNSVSFSPITGSNLLATGGNDNMVTVWDLDLGREVVRGAGHSQGVSSVAITPDETFVLSGGHDHTVRKWDLNDGTLEYTWGDFLDSVTSVSISADGNWVAAGSWDGTIHLNSLISDAQGSVQIGDRVNSLAFSPDGTRLAVGLGRLLHDGTVAVWNINSADLSSSILLKSDPLMGEASAVRFSPDGTMVAAGHGGGFVQIWSAGALKPLQAMPTGVNDRTVGVTFTPGGAPMLLTVSRNGYVHRWNATKGELIKGFKLNTGLSSVAFSADGSLLAMGTSNGSVLVLETGQIE